MATILNRSIRWYDVLTPFNPIRAERYVGTILLAQGFRVRAKRKRRFDPIEIFGASRIVWSSGKIWSVRGGIDKPSPHYLLQHPARRKDMMENILGCVLVMTVALPYMYIHASVTLWVQSSGGPLIATVLTFSIERGCASQKVPSPLPFTKKKKKKEIIMSITAPML